MLILDDPLSALDMEVADKILKEGICGLMSEKTRIITTHAIHYLKYADYVYVMDKGKIVQQGDYESIKNSELFSELKNAVVVKQLLFRKIKYLGKILKKKKVKQNL